MKKITKYVCEHCSREYRKEKNAEHHESICWKNKANKTCLTCISNGGIDSFPDDWNGSVTQINYIVCENDNCEGSDDMIPITNCEYWKEDTRSKKQKQKDYFKRISNGFKED